MKWTAPDDHPAICVSTAPMVMEGRVVMLLDGLPSSPRLSSAMVTVVRPTKRAMGPRPPDDRRDPPGPQPPPTPLTPSLEPC